jgi:hypothetical protein
MDVAEYNLRRHQAERIVIEKMDEYDRAPMLSYIANVATAAVGVFGTAALIGWYDWGSIGALTVPVVFHLPLLCLVEAFTPSRRDTHDDAHTAAYKKFGIDGVRDPSRGPSLFDRLSMFIDRPTANALAARAAKDVAKGVFGKSPTDVSYMVKGTEITPAPSPMNTTGPLTKFRMTESGELMMTHTVDGKLQSVGGRPSAARVDADGKVTAAVWHDDGVAAKTWRAGWNEELSINVQMVAGELRLLVNEIRYDVGHGPIADALDRHYDRALELSSIGYVEVPLTLDADGEVNVDALSEYLMTAITSEDDLDVEQAMRAAKFLRQLNMKRAPSSDALSRCPGAERFRRPQLAGHIGGLARLSRHRTCR